MSVLLLVGTRKGLFLLRGGDPRDGWEVDGPLLPGWSVYHAIVDARGGGLYACANNWVYGATVQRSDDLGQTWERSEALGLPEESGLKLEATWHVEPGRESEPGTLWLGGDPGVLFRSDDGGATWTPNAGILEHPTRDRWQPGAGGLCCHSIQLDPRDPNRLYVAISAAGAFRSDDDGETWTPVNAGVAADFLPDRYPDVGQCVHKLLLHPARPDRLWQQNHCGVYRSDDRGETWERLDGNGLPSGFGFALALDPDDADVAYVIPEESGEHRVTVGGRLGVYRTGDAGATWELATNGLPERAWAAVLREGFAYDEEGLYFGTQSGSIWASPRGGGEWTEAARDLPPILSVEAAAWR
ncbi:MAG: glycoside hydrolase [Actinomycetota bacterium]|nr:glycoside hydrolase [Actinomycetota bacterium]